MSSYLPAQFLNFENSFLKELFDPQKPVWEALKKIPKWLDAQKLGIIEGEVSPFAFLVDPEKIHIGKGTVVEPGAYLKGPLWIGENCVIRHGAYLRGHVIMGAKVVIGHDTETKNSIFFEGAQAAHFAYVGDSILGTSVNLGAGTKLANLRLDHQEVVIEGEKTGLRKFGSILGDFSQVGCNAVLNPGTLVGRETEIYPLMNVGGVIPEKSRVTQKLSIVISPKK